MAKITQVLARVDEARPNAFDSLLKVKWLATLDGRIAANIYRLQHSELAQFCYDGTDQEIELLVPFPHDDIYDLWLIAQIDMANGEYNKYQNSMVAYNAAFESFVHWFCSTYDPAQGYDEGCCDCGYRPPYFLTAYGLAVKAGFQGTEEEWLKSLIGKDGKPGDRVQLRYEGDQIQWRYIPADGDESQATEWVDLLDVAAIRGEIVEQTLADAQASAEDARMSMNAAYAARSVAETAAGNAAASEQAALQHVMDSDHQAKLAAGYAETAEAAAKRAEEAAASSGSTGEAGKDGGYYTPAVVQSDESTMEMSFVGSKQDMPQVPVFSITLPAGKDGNDGAQGIQGEQGPKGDKGDQGIQGPKGDKGDTGPQGIPGTAAQVRINPQTQMWEYANEYDAQGNPIWITSDIKASGEKGDPGEKGDTGAPGADGAKGKDGVSATHSWNGTTLTITSASGTSSANLKGEKGDKGDKGDTGETGAKGDKGDPGADGKDGTNGKDGADGQPGKDGYTPQKGIDYFDGAKGDTGADGKDGTSVTVKSVSESAADGGSNVVTFSDGKTVTIKNGSKGSTGVAGKTPVKGTDYFTEADKEEFLGEVEAVRYVQQTLNDREKKQALVNINAADLDYVNEIGDRVGVLERGKYVLYSSQTLTDGEKQTARQNIGAAPSSLADNVVLLTAQTLPTNQANQARQNIGAAPSSPMLTIIGVDADGTQHTFVVYGYQQGGGSNDPE